VRGTADQGGHGKAAGSPSRTCAGAACLACSAWVKRSRGRPRLGAISRRGAGASGGRFSRWHPQRVERFQPLYELRDSGVARLPLFGNFSYSAIFLHNFSLTNS
jgi:hypothetical protein